MPSKKETVKVTAVLPNDIDPKAKEPVRLWGIDFEPEKGKMVAEVDPVIAKAMKDAKRCK